MTNIYDFLNRSLKATTASMSASSIPESNPGSMGSATVYPDQLSDGELDGNIDIVGGYIQSKGFVSGTSGWRINAEGDAEFNSADIRGTLTAGSTVDTVVLDTMVSAEAITAGKLVVVLNDGRVCHGNGTAQLIPRVYGIATTSVAAGESVTVQKLGPYTTSGLTPGSFYGLCSHLATSGYGSETTTASNTTRDSNSDLALGFGQTITTSQIFDSAISFNLSTPVEGSYSLKIRLFQVFSSEGGGYAVQPSVTPTSITRSGSTATLDFPSPGYSFNVGDYVTVSGAAETEYNGTFRILTESVTDDTLTYTVSGTPATPATGTIVAYVRRAYATFSTSINSTGFGTGQLVWTFSLKNSNNSYNYHDLGDKILVEATADTAGQINVHYNSTSVYAGGSLWQGGVIDTGKDLYFTYKERYGSGNIAKILNTVTYGVFGSTYQSTNHPYPVTTSTIGLAKSATTLLLGNFNRS